MLVILTRDPSESFGVGTTYPVCKEPYSDTLPQPPDGGPFPHLPTAIMNLTSNLSLH